MPNEEFKPIPGPDGDTDPATQEWRKENWVEAGNPIHPKAELMGHAGDKYRSRAAQIRATNKDIGSDFGKKLGEYNDDMADHVERAAGQKFDEEQARQAAERVVGHDISREEEEETEEQVDPSDFEDDAGKEAEDGARREAAEQSARGLDWPDS